MKKTHQIRLEVVRPGPAHNQLLSPLTLYTALCGSSGPITFTIDLEQQELLNILARLRYTQNDRGEAMAVPNTLREAAVTELGRKIGDVFGKLTNLLVEQGHALGASTRQGEGDGESLIHLRLISSASEIANVPFEMAIAPVASPSEGGWLFMDNGLPVFLSREVRRARAVPMAWNPHDGPKILLIAAEPGRLRIPLDDHVRALVESMHPWIRYESADPVAAVKQRVRVLPNASIDDIYRVCADDDFSHVHILAHGGEYLDSGERRYGIALCDHHDRTRPQVVSGTRLAKALQAESARMLGRSHPQMVTLATCDAGGQGSVVIPGGSIAFDLHVAGVPIVVASQFPLTKAGSVTFARAVYPRVLRGDDPRQAIFEARRVLYSHHDRSHDWGSVIVYAALPEDFDEQVANLFEAQSKRAIDTALAAVDATMKKDGQHEGQDAFDRATSLLDAWEERLPTGGDAASRERRAEFYGMRGATIKRMALATLEADGSKRSEYRSLMQSALASYQQAVDERALAYTQYHWAVTQVLSIKIVLALEAGRKYKPSSGDLAMYLMARELADQDSQTAATTADRAWGYVSLAELELLSIPFRKRLRSVGEGGEGAEAIKATVREYGERIVDCVGPADFAVASTRRQFQRYIDHWPGTEKLPLGEIAQEAIDALNT